MLKVLRNTVDCFKSLKHVNLKEFVKANWVFCALFVVIIISLVGALLEPVVAWFYLIAAAGAFVGMVLDFYTNKPEKVQ